MTDPDEVKLLPCARDLVSAGADALARLPCRDFDGVGRGEHGLDILRRREAARAVIEATRPPVVTDEAVERGDATQFGDDVAEQMRTYFEAHKNDRWRRGTADNLMIGLFNIAARALASMPAVVSGLQSTGDHALPPSGLSPCGSQAKPAAAIARKGA